MNKLLLLLTLTALFSCKTSRQFKGGKNQVTSSDIKTQAELKLSICEISKCVASLQEVGSFFMVDSSYFDLSEPIQSMNPDADFFDDSQTVFVVTNTEGNDKISFKKFATVFDTLQKDDQVLIVKTFEDIVEKTHRVKAMKTSSGDSFESLSIVNENPDTNSIYEMPIVLLQLVN